MCGYLSTYPLDVLKTAAMGAVAGTPTNKVTMRALAGRLYTSHGGRWVLRGLMPTLCRGFVINAVNFCAFEWFIRTAAATSADDDE